MDPLLLAWCDCHVRTEEYDRTLPGAWDPREPDSWMALPSYRGASERHARDVMREVEREYRVRLWGSPRSVTRAALGMTHAERVEYVRRARSALAESAPPEGPDVAR